MTTLQIISNLLSIIYDLLFLIRGREVRTLEEIEKELDKVQGILEPYSEGERSGHWKN